MLKLFSVEKAIAYLAVSTIALAGYNSDYIPLAQVVAPPAIDYLLNKDEDINAKVNSKDK